MSQTSSQVYCCDQNNTNCSWQDSCSSNPSPNYTSVIVAGVLICVMIAIIIVCKLFVCSSKRLNDVKEEMILLRKLKQMRGEQPLERHGIIVGVPVAPKIPMIHATISKEAKDQFRTRLQKNVIITQQDSQNYFQETEEDMVCFEAQVRNQRGFRRASSSSSSISVPESWSNIDAFSPNNIKVHDYSESTLSSKDSTYDSSIISSRNIVSVYGKAPTRTPSKFQKLAGNSLSRDLESVRVKSLLKQTSTFSDNSVVQSDRSHYDRYLGLE